MKKTVLWCVTLCVSAAVSTQAQEQEEPLMKALRETFKKQYFSVNIISQFGGDFQYERTVSGSSGFTVPNLRIGFSGELDGGVSYRLWTNMVKTPAFLGADLSWRVLDGVDLTGGVFKVPFSAEDLTPESAIDFVNRSQVVVALSPSWQLGTQAEITLLEKTLWFAGGLFNGNGLAGLSNDGKDFMGVGSVRAQLRTGDNGLLSASVAIAKSIDTEVTTGGDFLRRFTGERLLLDGGIRWVSGEYLAAGETIVAEILVPSGTKYRPYGYHLTLGRMVSRRMQVLVRYDALKGDGLRADSNLAILGLNLWPTSATEFQLNYLVNTDATDLKYHRALAVMQLAF